MGEVRFWPRLVGGPGDGTPIPPDSRLRVRVPDPERVGSRYESKTVTDTLFTYTEYKVEIVPGEVAVRCFVPERWSASEANCAIARVLVEAAFNNLAASSERATEEVRSG